MSDFRERGKLDQAVHLLISGADFDSVCGKDFEFETSHDHVFTSRKERVTCPKCLEIMNAKATAEKESAR